MSSARKSLAISVGRKIKVQSEVGSALRSATPYDNLTNGYKATWLKICGD
jgi:hypothetical protein